MSTTTEHEPLTAWQGEDVTVGDVLDALHGIRAKFARTDVGDDEHGHPRNCVMTLIGIAPTESDERVARHTTQLISSEHPAQAIVIREEAPLRGHHLDAWITTEAQQPGAGCPTECEIITLHVRGAAAEHLAALVDPLLVSGVPTYLWWLGTPPFGKKELADALRVCDGLVVDSARFNEPFNSFRGLSRLLKAAHHRLGLADLQWSRLRPWREMIAQFFTPVDRRHFLTGIAEVGVDYAGDGRGNRIAAALITGWMAGALGWRLRSAAAGQGGVVVAHYLASGRSVEVDFRSVQREHLTPGELGAVRIAGASRGTTFRLSVQHDPERRPPPADTVYQAMHPTEGEDDAGFELAQRRAEWHRDVLHENLGSLHHTATGDAPGESRPRPPIVLSRDRRRPDTERVLLTLIEIGEGRPLRHVQQLDRQDEVALLLDLLSTGTHDEVFNRSLAAASALIDKF
ncbi:MAG TPA: glucose-6-phosphate dehydrogenase assembly protein OpcA [Candidatus Dormibacteraeota bacterium]|nr:glucose-6-phosphate dehydrogenase assembly protein OpcA [Candidatus Dormibacteraeota bacterium]